MSDIFFATIRALFALSIAVIAIMRKDQFVNSEMKSFLLVPLGFMFIAFGSILDIFSQFPQFDTHLILGSKSLVHDYLKEFVGYILGVVLVIWGIFSLMPYFKQINDLQSELDKSQSNYRILYEEIKNLNEELEFKVELRTKELGDKIKELESTQQELMDTERLALLGGLVSGVSHEVNTPIGVAVTASSFLADNVSNIRTQLDGNALKKSDFEKFLNDTEEGTLIILQNAQRASQLINHFKQLAADQSNQQLCEIVFEDLVDHLSNSISHAVKRVNAQVVTQIPKDLTLFSYPGPVVQLLFNLLNNSLKHAFDGIDQGLINIHITALPHDHIRITYFDNGIGLNEESRSALFEFNRGDAEQHGLRIIHQVITNQLNGSIHAYQPEPSGLGFIIDLPPISPSIEQKRLEELIDQAP